MTDTKQEPFQALEIPRKELGEGNIAQYRVYSTEKEFVQLSAVNAQTAIRASGIAAPLRVERYVAAESNVLEFPHEEIKPRKLARPVIEHLPAGSIKLHEETYMAPQAILGLDDAAQASDAPAEALPPTAEKQEEVAKAEQPEVAAAEPEAAGDAPLSNDDVEKLLNS